MTDLEKDTSLTKHESALDEHSGGEAYCDSDISVEDNLTHELQHDVANKDLDEEHGNDEENNNDDGEEEEEEDENASAGEKRLEIHIAANNESSVSNEPAESLTHSTKSATVTTSHVELFKKLETVKEIKYFFFFK